MHTNGFLPGVKVCLAAFVYAAAAATVTASCPGFSPEVRVGVGNQPTFVAIADINKDGKNDLVVTNGTSNTVSVLINDGFGGFPFNGEYLTGVAGPGGQFGAQPFSVAVDDFNGDGNPDFAVAVYSVNTAKSFVTFMLGVGDGTFVTGVPYDAGTFVIDVKAADMNRDGKKDLVVANYDSGSVSVLLGNGDGTFGPRTSYVASLTTNPRAFGVAVADFNGDGIADVAAALVQGSSISVRFGNGDGTLGPLALYPAGTNPLRPAVGDFNRDGKPDIVVANGDGSATVLFNDGTGAFPTLSTRTTGGTGGFGLGGVSVAVNDLNRDGRADIVVGNAGLNRMSVLLGTGSTAAGVPALSSPVDFIPGNFPTGVAAGDVDGDGRADVVIANEGLAPTVGNTVSIFRNQCSCSGIGQFSPAVPYSSGSSGNGIASAVADFNRDGRLDVAVGGSGATSVSILLASASGGFQAPLSAGNVTQPRSIAAGDVNRDGIADLAVANGTNVTVLLGLGNGTFNAGTNFSAGANALVVMIDDVNRNGSPDLLVLADDGSVSVLFGVGNGTFGAPVNTVLGVNLTSLAIGDFDRDRIDDLAVTDTASTPPSVVLARGDGLGNFTVFNSLNLPVSSTPVDVALPDVNRDGFPEVVAAFDNSIGLFVSGFGGNFSARVDYSFSSTIRAITTGDVDGTGIPDVLVQTSAGNIQPLLGNADGSLSSPVLMFGSSSSAFTLKVADFDRDGEADIVAPGGSSLFFLRGSANCAPSVIGDRVPRAAGITSTSNVLTVIDAEDDAVNVTLNTVPSDITVTSISPTGAIRSASVGVPACSTAPGTRTVTIDAVDSGGASTTSFFTVSITANAPPAAGTYPGITGTQALAPGADASVTPSTAASDPEGQSVTYSAVTVSSGFTGTAAVNSATGEVSIHNAGPPGRYDFTVRVTDSPCSKQSTTTFTVEVSATFTEPPQNVQAIAISSTDIQLTWIPVTGGTQYEIQRRPNIGALWEPVVRPDMMPITNTTFIDTGRQPNTTYLYRVRGLAGQFAGPFSSDEAGTTVIFTDDPLVAGATAVKSVHFTELRTAINALRAAAALSPFVFTADVAAGAAIQAAHVSELRSALSPAYSTIYGRPLTVTDTTLVAGQVLIKAVHLQELRNQVK